MSDTAEKRARKNLAEIEEERDQAASDYLDSQGDELCNAAEIYLEKEAEYEATHDAALTGQTHIDHHDFQVPLKFHQSGKNEGEFQKWPEYEEDPPGLYQVPSRGGGYEYEVRHPYGIMLAVLSRTGYRSVEAFLRDCQKGRV